MPGGQPPLRISVIIPTWRDAENLARLLPKLAAIPAVTETIVVNASRGAETDPIVEKWGATLVKYSPPNRGAQMNAGADAAEGDVLLFQHADTHVEEAHIKAIAQIMRKPDVVGGAFYRKFDGRHPRLTWLEPVARFLSRNGGTLYGDQSVFVRRNIFEEMGGFAAYPLMEDVEFSKRLRREGRVVFLDPPVHSSGRQHLKKGAWRMTVRNALFMVLYKFGVSPVRLHRWYYPTPELPRGIRGRAPRASAKSAARY